MAKNKQAVVLEAPKAKSIADIVNTFLADIEDHQDAKLVTVNTIAPREREWYDTPLRDQEEKIIRIRVRYPAGTR